MTPEQESMSDLTKRLREMAGGNEAHYCYKAADRIEQLERERDELRALARKIIALYPDDCRLDHHGYCQEHFLEENCTIKAAKDALARIDALLAAR